MLEQLHPQQLDFAPDRSQTSISNSAPTIPPSPISQSLRLFPTLHSDVSQPSANDSTQQPQPGLSATESSVDKPQSPAKVGPQESRSTEHYLHLNPTQVSREKTYLYEDPWSSMIEGAIARLAAADATDVFYRAKHPQSIESRTRIGTRPKMSISLIRSRIDSTAHCIDCYPGKASSVVERLVISLARAMVLSTGTHLLLLFALSIYVIRITQPSETTSIGRVPGRRRTHRNGCSSGMTHRKCRSVDERIDLVENAHHDHVAQWRLFERNCLPASLASGIGGESGGPNISQGSGVGDGIGTGNGIWIANRRCSVLWCHGNR